MNHENEHYFCLDIAKIGRALRVAEGQS